MKKFLKVIAATSVLLTAAAIADSGPAYKLSAEVRSGSYNEWNEVTIVSTTDNLVIEKVTMNRDHCRVGVHPMTGKLPYPVKLNYGDSVKIDFFECPNMLDAQVYTNQGNNNWTFK